MTVSTQSPCSCPSVLVRESLVIPACLIVYALYHPTSAQAEPAVDRAARIVAQALAEAIQAGDEDAAAVLFVLPANLDGDAVSSLEALRARWAEVLARAEVRRLSLEAVEVLPMSEALERYGPPPERLGDLNEEGLVVAIVRFDRAQVVAVLARREGRWAIVALTD